MIVYTMIMMDQAQAAVGGLTHHETMILEKDQI